MKSIFSLWYVEINLKMWDNQQCSLYCTVSCILSHVKNPISDLVLNDCLNYTKILNIVIFKAGLYLEIMKKGKMRIRKRESKIFMRKVRILQRWRKSFTQLSMNIRKYIHILREEKSVPCAYGDHVHGLREHICTENNKF